MFLIISHYLKQKAYACRRNVSQIRLEVSFTAWRAGGRPTNRMASRDGGRLPANQIARRGSRVLAVSEKKFLFACFFIVATSSIENAVVSLSQ
jgi:hypothetical protein